MYGTILKQLRGERTQAEQARLLKMSPQQLCDIEAERRDPRLSTLRKLATKYGITLAELVDPENAKQK